MATTNIRVLVVDDSTVIREIICDLLTAAPDVEVAGTAQDGIEALSQIGELQPDVVTLDVQMPNMDGLQTLDAILARDPIPVIMVSALTQRSADTTLSALERGALDYVAKPEGAARAKQVFQDELLRKIRSAAGMDVRRVLRIRRERQQRVETNRRKRKSSDAKDFATQHLADKCIAIGISTGGPPALTGLFEALHPPMPPIVVVQHMPAQFTGAFAARLDSISELSVKEAAPGDVLKLNHVLIAAGDTQLSLEKRGATVSIHVHDGPLVSGHKPSVDVMMQCAAEIFGDRCLGVIITGMGRDGVDGCRLIREKGGYVLGQDEVTSDVYRMNKAAFVEGYVDRQFALDDAPAKIRSHIKRIWKDKMVELAHQS